MNQISTVSLPTQLHDPLSDKRTGTSAEHAVAVAYHTRFKHCLELWFDEPEPPGSFDTVTRYRAPVRGTTGETSDFYSLQIDLTKSRDEIFKRFARNTRAQIRKSIEGDGFRFDFMEDASISDLKEFVAFYDMFADSKHLPRLYLPRMLGHLESGSLSLTRVVRAGSTLAWHANVRRPMHVGMMLSASHFRFEDLPEIRRLIGRANRCLHWEEMLHYKQQGCAVYDFGGWYEGTSDQEKLRINRFKEEFGGDKVHEFTVTENRSLRAKAITAINRARNRTVPAHVPAKSPAVERSTDSRWSLPRAAGLNGRRIENATRRAGRLVRALRRMARSVLWFERVAFYEADLTQDRVRQRPSVVDVDFIVATSDDLLKRYAATIEADFGLEPQDVEQRLGRSHVALLCLHRGSVIAMVWLAFNAQKVSEIGRTLALRPGEVLTYNEVTLPAWRGHNISPHLNQFAEEYARQHSATRRVNWRRVSNAPAIRVATKLGDKVFAVVTTVRVMGVPQAFVFGLSAAALLPLVRDSSQQRAA